MSETQESERPLGPLTPRQQELMKIIQNLPAEHRHTLKVICRGAEPWEIEEVIEHRRIGEVKPPKA